jgi:hypothetical protein
MDSMQAELMDFINRAKTLIKEQDTVPKADRSLLTKDTKYNLPNLA